MIEVQNVWTLHIFFIFEPALSHKVIVEQLTPNRRSLLMHFVFPNTFKLAVRQKRAEPTRRDMVRDEGQQIHSVFKVDGVLRHDLMECVQKLDENGRSLVIVHVVSRLAESENTHKMTS